MKFLTDFLTKLRGKPQILQNREISPTPIREKLMIDSLLCPYCASRNFVKRGFRAKKLERVQLLLCMDCHKTFTPQITKGKHYPLATIFDAVSLYNLGYSLEESCRRVNTKAYSTKKPTSTAGSGDPTKAGSNLTYHLKSSLAQIQKLVNTQNSGVEVAGFAPAEPWMIGQIPYSSTPTSELVSHIDLQASTLSNWLTEFKEMMPFGRMRDFMMQKYTPQNAIVTATLAHQQLYRYRFHRAKCAIAMGEHFHHSFFKPLKEFLELVPGECPHQYFQEGLRASDAPLTFSKTAMIVRGKTNFATRVAAFVLQSVKERKSRHEAVQKFMLYNDSVTVATEVPVYLTRDDLEHMKTQLGFEIYNSKIKMKNEKLQFKIQNSENPTADIARPSGNKSLPKAEAPIAEADIGDIAVDLPKLITGHIDILQIRNGMVHLLDFKPNAEKERPIEQLTLYAMALSRLTGLRLFEFKCAWFDEKDYFEFYPLHVLHKPKKARRRRKVETMEGIYNVNKDENRISQIRPVMMSS